MKTKNFEQVMREIFEEIKNYSAYKDDNETAVRKVFPFGDTMIN